MTDFTVLIADDEPLARRRLMRLVAKIDWVKRTETAADVDETCRLANEIQPDILLLDIQMPGGSGFDVLERLAPDIPVVIFVTAFDHYALRAFEANAVDYVTKPIEPGRFNLAMERARLGSNARLHADQLAELQETIAALKHALNVQTQWAKEFWLKVRGDYVRIEVEKIIRLQADRDYVRIYTLDGEYLHHESLRSLQQQLDPAEFMRIHRSSIVRRNRIVRIKQVAFAPQIAMLNDGSEVRIGRTYAAVVRASLTRNQ